MLNIKSIPQIPQRSKVFSSHRWAGLFKHLYQMHVANSPLEEGINWNVSVDSKTHQLNRSVANAVFFRGPKHNEEIDLSSFADPRLYAPWHSNPFKSYYQPCSFNRYDKCAAVLSNSQGIVQPIQSVFSKAESMFDTRAYLHQYEAKGVQHEYFEQAFLRIEQVVMNYQHL